MSLKYHYFSIPLFVIICPLFALIWPWAPFGGGSSWDHEFFEIIIKILNIYRYIERRKNPILLINYK